MPLSDRNFFSDRGRCSTFNVHAHILLTNTQSPAPLRPYNPVFGRTFILSVPLGCCLGWRTPAHSFNASHRSSSWDLVRAALVSVEIPVTAIVHPSFSCTIDIDQTHSWPTCVGRLTLSLGLKIGSTPYGAYFSPGGTRRANAHTIQSEGLESSIQ